MAAPWSIPLDALLVVAIVAAILIVAAAVIGLVARADS